MPPISSNIPLAAMTDWLRQLLAQLRETNQRRLLCVQGEMQWCDDISKIVRENAIQSNQQTYIAISDRQLGFESVAYSKVETLLGREASLVVVDLFEGINPDVLCIASGLLMQGGLMLLLSDKPEKGSAANDKFGSWQNGAKKTDNFIHYFYNELRQYQEACVFLKQDEALAPLEKMQPADVITILGGKTQAQLDILNQLHGWLDDHTQSVMLIKADRGRGKSTCLGFIVQALKSRPALKLIVSAYSKVSASILLQQAGDTEFIAPDQLVKEKRQADVLIIDEAAMLPFPMLRQLVGRYKKIVMATTTGGYEGTGQGFMHRFLANLPPEKLLSLSINHPVRWTSQDNLEPCLNAVLLLKPKLHSITKQAFTDKTLAQKPAAQQSQSSEINYQIVDHKNGIDTALFKKVYELMASVHYRTRPSDLRMLMDNPDLSLVLAEQSDQLIGILILNSEGGFDADLCEQVYLGKRRPKGHLLAQMLTAQASVKNFACYRGMRIQRIAVIPSMRRQGVGAQLIDKATEYARDQQCDTIGACFAFDADISQFWHHCQFPLVHISFSQGKSSGNHSVAVLKPLTNQLEVVVEQLKTRLQKQLPVWLTHYLSDMDVESITALLRFSGFEARHNELDEIEAFVSGFKGFDLSYASLQPYVMQLVAQSNECVDVHDWLIEKAIQNKPWEQLTSGDNIVGRKQCQEKLRTLILNLRIQSQINLRIDDV
ncbi:MAG: tRNA(Met) cytidine acetyltransferase [Polaribacter sp.]|jgi:tRNA(Met) cytidine acetyltransferase